MANRLRGEKSPYLRQHAQDPVDWYPWGDEPFARAQAEGKPVFVSIGYSTCHWCHVMAEESFRDQETAAYLNSHFVSVKVDREERPDVDMLYMNLCQALTGRGGWPLSVFVTPDRRPFFAGSYFPKVPRGGLPAFINILREIKQRWEAQRERLESASREVLSLGVEDEAADGGDVPVEALSERAVNVLDLLFDAENGGFGEAPKFPPSIQLLFLEGRLDQGRGGRQVEMVTKTLDVMAKGGLFDQIGFGFHRYCVDARWRIPHFEKMLYDQAMLIMAYSNAYRLLGRERYRDVVVRTLSYAQDRLGGPEGSFYAGEDADSEGEEGRFYLWSRSQLREIFTSDDAELASAYFGVGEQGNFEGEFSVPVQAMELESFAQMAGIDTARAAEEVERLRRRMAQVRERRVRPALDDKVITAWNALMAVALVSAHRALSPGGQEVFLAPAERCMEFLLDNLVRDGRLFRRWACGEAAHPGFLDDYAAVTWALLELHQATGEGRWLSEALPLARRMVDEFSGGDAGLYYSPSWLSDLPVRQMERFDGPAPSGASMAILVLETVSDLTGEAEFSAKAVPAIRRAKALSAEAPLSQLFALWAMERMGRGR